MQLTVRSYWSRNIPEEPALSRNYWDPFYEHGYLV